MTEEQELLFAKADGGDPGGINSQAGQIVLAALGATLAQGQIVLLDTAQVTISLSTDGKKRMTHDTGGNHIRYHSYVI